MTHDTITIELNGDILLDDFAQTMRYLSDLIQSLTKNVGDNADIVWEVEELSSGSAVATIRGSCENMEPVERVVSAYHTIGHYVATQKPLPYSSEIQQKVTSLVNMLGNHVTSIRFATPLGESDIVSRLHGAKAPTYIFAYGAVKGTVETLTMRKERKFTLYDALFDRAVACYFEQEQEDLVRNIWGKNVVVAGYVGRHPDTGRPSVIRTIKTIDFVPAGDLTRYRDARGITPWNIGDENSEDAIRRLRDAS